MSILKIYSAKPEVLARRLAMMLAGIALVVLLLGPWAIYEIALSNIVTLPSPPSTPPVPAANMETVWRMFKEHGPVEVEPLSPHGYAFALLAHRSLPSGARTAWLVARNHNMANLKDRRWWHMSGAALTIWLTRHWSTEQLVAEAHRISGARQPKFSPAVVLGTPQAARPLA